MIAKIFHSSFPITILIPALLASSSSPRVSLGLMMQQATWTIIFVSFIPAWESHRLLLHITLGSHRCTSPRYLNNFVGPTHLRKGSISCVQCLVVQWYNFLQQDSHTLTKLSNVSLMRISIDVGHWLPKCYGCHPIWHVSWPVLVDLNSWSGSTCSQNRGFVHLHCGELGGGCAHWPTIHHIYRQPGYSHTALTGQNPPHILNNASH